MHLLLFFGLFGHQRQHQWRDYPEGHVYLIQDHRYQDRVCGVATEALGGYLVVTMRSAGAHTGLSDELFDTLPQAQAAISEDCK